MTKIIRNHPKPIFYHDDEDCLRDQFGGIITAREYYELLDKVGSFYENVNDDDIEEYNKAVQVELHNELISDSKRAENKPENQGYVYFVQADGQHYKIGGTSNLKSRMKSLQVASPNDLRLIAWLEINDWPEKEDQLHEYFDDKKIHGEWFDITVSEIIEWARLYDIELLSVEGVVTHER